MKFVRIVLVVFFSLSFIMSDVISYSAEIRSWADVVRSSGPVKIYIQDVANKTDDKKVDAGKVTEIVKKMFSGRKDPGFTIVKSTSDADIIFKGVISEYVWSKKAPLTNVYSAGGFVLDEMTRGKKNWARMELDYKISDAKDGKLLLDYETQVTLKREGIPEDKSYEMINERLPKILAMDIFKRYKRNQ